MGPSGTTPKWVIYNLWWLGRLSPARDWRAREMGMRTLSVVAAIVAGAFFMSGESSAQKKGCPANYENTCMSTCVKQGGQARKCPQYCAARLRKNCAT
jgi:hypothetical protein